MLILPQFSLPTTLGVQAGQLSPSRNQYHPLFTGPYPATFLVSNRHGLEHYRIVLLNAQEVYVGPRRSHYQANAYWTISVSQTFQIMAKKRTSQTVYCMQVWNAARFTQGNKLMVTAQSNMPIYQLSRPKEHTAEVECRGMDGMLPGNVQVVYRLKSA
jgi:hypothetical protein